jgi:transposase
VIGVTVTKRGRKHVPAAGDRKVLERVAALYAGGRSIRAVAAELAWSYGVTHSRLHAAKAAGLVELRPRGHRGARLK